MNFAINNFGGSSSRLTVFSALPIQYVFIDRASLNNRLLCQATINFCKAMNCIVVSKNTDMNSDLEPILGIDYTQSRHTIDGELVSNSGTYHSK